MMASVLDIFEEMSYGDVKESSMLGKEWLMDKKFGPFIDGISETPKNDDELQVVDCLGGISVSVGSSTSANVQKAVKSCLDARKTWQAIGSQREVYLLKLVKYLEKHAPLLAQIESINRGVQLKDPAEFDVPALISWFKYYASWVHIATIEYTEFRPFGVTAAIVSENTPLMALGLLLAPAIAAGNCVCLGVPNKTSLTAMLLAEIFIEAGIPHGVLNVIPASQETFNQLVLHKDVSNIRAFGSTNFVRDIKQKLSSFPLKTISTLMSGRTPMLVFDSCDVHSVVEAAVRSAWHNQGSVPWSIKLILVQESIYLSFVKKLKLRLESIRIGNSFDKMADVGKPYDCKVQENVAKMTSLAIANGTEVFQRKLTANEAANGFFPPTLLIGGEIKSNQVIDCQEYAPVISVVPFRTPKEAAALANNSRYGLAASVWTNKLTLAMDVADRLQFGTVWVNCHGLLDPSVAIQGWKESGCGDFGGKTGFLECLYQQAQTNISAVTESENSSPAVQSPPIKAYKTEVLYKLYYAGGYKNADGNATRSIVMEKYQSLLTFSVANRKDVRMAVEAAASAFAGWSSNTSSRAQLLNSIAMKIDSSQQKLTRHLQAMQKNENDVIEYSNVVKYAAAAFKYWACVCDKSSQVRVHKPGFMVNTSREPLGPVALGIYCNKGLETSLCQEAMWQLAAALAFGNTVLVVVDMMNPSGVVELFQSVCEVAIPSGVLSVLTGNSFTVMKSLAEHQSVNAIFHWNYPSNLLKEIQLAACENMKVVSSCILENNCAQPVTRESAELSVTRSKAVWVSKGEVFA